MIHMLRQSLELTLLASLYGDALWDITCRQLSSLEVAFNNILR